MMLAWLLPLLVVGLAAASQLASRPSPDVAWLLYASREVMHGAGPGTDILENTPPMIFGLKLPAVWLAGMLGLQEWHVWVVAVTVTALCCLVLAGRLLGDIGATRGGAMPLAAALGAFAFLLLPAADFGQREHVTAILVLPYVALLGSRLRGRRVRSAIALLAGMLAGIGIGIKPHFVLFFVGAVLAEVRRLGWRKVVLPEHVAVVGLGAAYVGSVWLWAPGYPGYALVYGSLYRHFLPLPLVAMLSAEGAVPGLLALGTYAALRRLLPSGIRELADALAVATSTFDLAGVLQGKGWRYHFLPSMIFAVLLAGVVVRSSWRELPTWLARIYLGLGAGLLAALGLSSLVEPLQVLRHPLDSRQDADPNLHSLLPLVQATGPGGYVAVFSSNIASGFPLVLEGHARWAFRYPSLWPLVALYENQLSNSRLVVPRAYQERGALESAFTDSIRSDLVRTRPVLLLVVKPDTVSRGWGGARRFDYLQYFASDPRFTTEVLQHYRSLGTIGSYDALWRIGPDSLPSPQLSGLEGVDAPPGWYEAWPLAKILMVAGSLLGAISAWRASRCGLR